MQTPMPASEDDTSQAEAHLRLAEAVRTACLESVLQAYEDAQMRGLCHEGAWEVAVGALRALDVEQIASRTIRNRQSKI